MLTLVDSMAEMQAVVRSPGGDWGKVAVARHAADLDLDAIDAAIADNWNIEVSSRDDGVFDAVQEHLATRPGMEGRLLHAAPITARGKGAQAGMEVGTSPDKGMAADSPDVAAEMMSMMMGV
jgi:hypothetical protein